MSGEPAAVLVVDDDPVNRQVLTFGLEKQGHRVVGAADGAEGLALLVKEPFDAVLLDIVMPGLDGFAVLERIKGDPRLATLPVIVISGVDEMDSVVRCIELGAEDYLPKPVDPLLLRARISAGLARKHLGDLQREYVEQVGHMAEAAKALETGRFDAHSLAAVAERTDALGELARVFQRMAVEVLGREQRLRQQVWRSF